MAAWPSTLPKPLLSGYQGDSGANVSRTEFDSGPARQRLNTTTDPDGVTVSWKFKPAEMVIFKAFWKTTINYGTDWFSISLNIGDGFATYQARLISGKYQYQALPGMNWQVTAKLDVR